MALNYIGLGFLIGAVVGILVNSVVAFSPTSAVTVIVVTSIAGAACAAFFGGFK